MNRNRMGAGICAPPDPHLASIGGLPGKGKEKRKRKEGKDGGRVGVPVFETWPSHCGCCGYPDTPKIQVGVSDTYSFGLP